MALDHDLDDLLGEMVNRIESLTGRVNDLEKLESAMAHNYGWIGDTWQKDPLRLGYSERINENWSNTNLVAGANNVDGTTVPAGEIWVIANLTMFYIGTVPTSIEMLIFDGANTTYLYKSSGIVVSNQYYDKQGCWVLKAGDRLRVTVIGATAGDDLYASANGFRMDIDQ